MATPFDAIKALAQAASDELTGLTRDLYAGQISLPQWMISTASTLKDAHIANGIAGAGGAGNVGLGGYARMGTNLLDEFRYLFNFGVDIAKGDVSEAQALARIQQYGNATEQAYWREFGDKADRAGWAGLPVLDQVPRDGDTVCRGNCACSLREDDDGLHWELSAVENCPDCEALAAGSPYRPGGL